MKLKFKEKYNLVSVLRPLLETYYNEESNIVKTLRLNNIKNDAFQLISKNKIPKEFYSDIFTEENIYEEYWNKEDFEKNLLKWTEIVFPEFCKQAKKELGIKED